DARAPLSDVLLWAEDPAHAGAGACTGDSGGPMLDAAGEVAALTLWSAGDGKRQCGALTQALWLAPYRAWIVKMIAPK
ncbi:MAG: trypsin-like serine protease, partial [Janthinobacterium lividum]